MKHSIIFAGLATIFFSGMFFQPKVKHHFPAEQKTVQTIHIGLGSEQRYASPVYAHALADVQVRIIKWNGNKQEVLWENQFSNISLQQHAGVAEFLSKDIPLPVTVTTKDRIIVNYLVTYKDRGSKMMLQYDREIVPASGKDAAQVTI